MEEVKCANKNKVFFVAKNLTICFTDFLSGKQFVIKYECWSVSWF